MKSLSRSILALACAALAGTTIVVPAAAAPKYDVQVLVEKAFSGTITTPEKAALVKNHPDVAAVIPDLSASTTQVQTVRPAIKQGGITMAATTNCMTYTGWNTLKSVLGFTIYRFQHSATVCSNGSTVTSHSSPTYEISQVDPTVSTWSTVDRSVTGVGSTQSRSRIQVRVTQCILKYGCYSNTYPTGTIVANRNNTASITTTL